MKKYLGLALVGVLTIVMASVQAAPLPDPSVDLPLAQTHGDQTIVLAGGCFWGMQDVFQHLKGVKQTVVGYAGGKADTAHYDMVSTGTTGHAESVQVTYDPSEISLGQILKVYFAVAHDPTELDRQGPDHGSQYRSEIFFSSPEQQKVATAYISQLQQSKVFSDPIVTKLEPLDGFYKAEDYHQNYAALHPNNMYIAINDTPKVRAFEKDYPQLYVKTTIP